MPSGAGQPAPLTRHTAQVSVRPVRLFGDPVLRARAAEVVDFDKELRNLVRDLLDTMTQESAAGLAAPQLGIALRVFSYHCDDGSWDDGICPHYSTAMACIILQVPNNYLPILQK